MKQTPDASGEGLMSFLAEAVEPGSTLHTDGWAGYRPAVGKGYVHQVTILKGRKKSAAELMPRVRRIASLLKRWILGTHQGAISHESIWSFTWMSSPSGSIGASLAIAANSSAVSCSRPSSLTPSRTNCWFGAPLRLPTPTTTCSGYLSRVNTQFLAYAWSWTGRRLRKEGSRKSVIGFSKKR